MRNPGNTHGLTPVKKLVLSAMFLALGLVLPFFTGQIPEIGSMLLPMHIPVLLCGLVCGPILGLICGIFTPVLSSLITGMPGPAYLPSMICELAVYGLLAGAMIKLIKTEKPLVNLYASLITAMIGGRIVYGLMNALIFRAGAYSIQMWMTASFVTALPGIILQLLLLPAVVYALQKAKLA